MNRNSIYRSEAGRAAIMRTYDSVLEIWPRPCETSIAPTRHGETFVVASGQQDGPALVLLHGGASNSAFWLGDVIAYGRRYRTYCVDMPGEPGKSSTNRPSWAGFTFGEWLEDVFDFLQLPRASLLGISQGGWAALNFAVSNPERVEKLVLICPGGVCLAKLGFLLKALFYSMLGEWGRERIKGLALGHTDEWPREVDEYISLIMREFKPRIGNLPLYDDEELARLIMPVMLLGGELDAILNTSAIKARLERLLPDFSALILAGKGHAVTGVSGHVLDFLTEAGNE